MPSPTPSGTWRRPQRLSNETSINNTATIESIKRMADNVWREMEAFVDGYSDDDDNFHQQGLNKLAEHGLNKLAEHVANLVQRIKTELV